MAAHTITWNCAKKMLTKDISMNNVQISIQTVLGSQILIQHTCFTQEIAISLWHVENDFNSPPNLIFYPTDP